MSEQNAIFFLYEMSFNKEFFNYFRGLNLDYRLVFSEFDRKLYEVILNFNITQAELPCGNLLGIFDSSLTKYERKNQLLSVYRQRLIEYMNIGKHLPLESLVSLFGAFLLKTKLDTLLNELLSDAQADRYQQALDKIFAFNNMTTTDSSVSVVDFNNVESLLGYSRTDEADSLNSLGGNVGELFGAFVRGEIFCIVAPSKAGKSFCKQQIALEGLMSGHSVLYINLEMKEDLLVQRMLAYITNTVISDRNRSLLTYNEEEDKVIGVADNRKLLTEVTSVQLKQAFSYYSKNLRLVTVKRGGLLLENLYNLIKLQISNGFRPDYIVLDYADLVIADRKKDPLEGQDEVFRRLADIALETNTALITSTQTNRGGFESDYDISALGGSYRKLTHAGKVVSLFRQKEQQNITSTRVWLSRHSKLDKRICRILNDFNGGRWAVDSYFKR